MPIPERLPEVTDSLRALRALGVPVECVLDVGILHGTAGLMQVFPDVKHHLFEPVDNYFDIIHKAYSKLDYELHQVALSDSDGSAWQIGICRDGTGQVTHSQLRDEPQSADDDPAIVSCTQVKKARLDSLLDDLDAATPYLLKLDVDGIELQFIEGAARTLRDASVVVIEVTNQTFLPRANAVAQHGFSFFDLVDLTYYCGTFYQGDAIFIRDDIVASLDALRPMQVKPFDQSQWFPVSYKVLGV